MELRKRSRHEICGSNKFEEKKQKKDISKEICRIEHFPGEIWFELFSYFDGESLINSFSQLNCSIEYVLTDSRLPIHLNISSSNCLIPSPFHFHQIVSLGLNYSCLNSNEMIDIRSFIRLRSLSLMFINEEQLEKTSQFQLDHLRQISIKSKCARFIIKMISIYFPNVCQMKLDSMGREFVVKSNPYEKKINRIEKLILNGTMKLGKLFRLWSFVPNLRSFSLLNGGVHQCDYWMDENVISHRRFPENLTKINLNIFDDDLSFSNLERLIPPNVHYVKISGSMSDDDLSDYISSNNWIRLMSNCLPNLQRIKLDLSSYFDPGDSSGLQKTLSKYRRNPFFRHTTIQSQNFFLTIKGFIQPVLND